MHYLKYINLYIHTKRKLPIAIISNQFCEYLLFNIYLYFQPT